LDDRLQIETLIVSSLKPQWTGMNCDMPTGTSIFLIAVGAILRYAVTTTVSGVSLSTVGLILMLVGILGLILSLFYLLAWRPRRTPVVGERVVERDPYDPNQPPIY
jgi:Domain of unknown function (DUF6458)